MWCLKGEERESAGSVNAPVLFSRLLWLSWSTAGEGEGVRRRGRKGGTERRRGAGRRCSCALGTPFLPSRGSMTISFPVLEPMLFSLSLPPLLGYCLCLSLPSVLLHCLSVWFPWLLSLFLSLSLKSSLYHHNYYYYYYYLYFFYTVFTLFFPHFLEGVLSGYALWF